MPASPAACRSGSCVAAPASRDRSPKFIPLWNEKEESHEPMNKPGSVPRDAIPDILAYILSVNKLPMGETELSHDMQLLKKIRIEATKPEQSHKSDKSE